MWFGYALLSGGLYTVNGLMTRHVLRKQEDAWAFSFFFSAIGAVVSLPFMMASLKLAGEVEAWGLMLVVGLLIVLHNFMNFTAGNYLEASLSGVITKLRLAWTLLLGVMVLGEEWSMSKLVGTGLAVMAGMMVAKKFARPEKLKGVGLVAAATVVYSTVVLLYKYLFEWFNPASLTFFIFLIPAGMNLMLMPRAVERIRKIYQRNGQMVVMACGLGALANLAMNKAFDLGEISRVPVVIESFLIATLVGEHVWLKEQQGLTVKAIAVGLALAGVLLIKLG